MITADRHHQWPVVSALFTDKPSDAQHTQLWNKLHRLKTGHRHDSYPQTVTEHIGCLLNVPFVPQTLVLSLIVYTLKSVIWCPSATDGKGERKEHCTDNQRKIQLCTKTTHQLQHRHAHGHNPIHQVSRHSDQKNFHSTFQDSTNLQN